ncbi:MAG: transcriptional regulator, partial [Muribaculaceae bacterium]|nr:transcriptional regulator [Muribaculaceae bacterium]
MENIDDLRFTPENITSLGPDEVFVFGSNLQGMHCGGAARTAVLRFGAIMGQGVGIQGQSYAIPT